MKKKVKNSVLQKILEDAIDSLLMEACSVSYFYHVLETCWNNNLIPEIVFSQDFIEVYFLEEV